MTTATKTEIPRRARDDKGPALPLGSPGNVQVLAVESIERDPKQPRTEFDAEALQGLADSIRQQGVLQPVLVRRKDPPTGPIRYTLIVGERRWRAAKLAGNQYIPGIVRVLHDEDIAELQLLENLQREGLTALEEAAGFERLRVKFKMSTATVAKKIGKSERHVQARLQLLKLDPMVGKELNAGTISVDTALTVNAKTPLHRKTILDELKTQATQRGGPVSVRAADAVIAKRTGRTKPQTSAPRGNERQTYPPPYSENHLGRAVNAGQKIDWPKGANAVRVKYLKETIVLKDDVDTLRNAGLPASVEFGTVKYQSRGRPNRATFKEIKP